MGIVEKGLSRRAMLQGAGALVVGAYVSAGRAFADTAAPAEAPIPPNAFVRIGSDDVVTVIVKHIEFGQGPFTGLATIVAEELDADWSQMRAKHAPADVALYKNLLFGIQGTGGSSAVANSYEQLRKAAAQARSMLVSAAAADWGVPQGEIAVERGVIRHAATGREGRFGQFAAAAAKLPVPAEVALKDPKDFRLIGHEDVVTRLDVPAKTDGKAQFTMDIHEPGMLTVTIARPPRFGGKVNKFDATEALKVKGVVAVKPVPSGVAVYAESTWPAIKARGKLAVDWDEKTAEKRGSEDLIAEYRTLAEHPGVIAAQHGDPDKVLAAADKVIETEYLFPYLAHAPMEPLDGYLKWDGKMAAARYGCQLQTGDQMAIAMVLGIKPDQVSIETMLAGGSFGRRGELTSGFATELAEVAEAFGIERPIKLVWTREDDITGGHYRPLILHRMKGAVKNGKIAAWTNTVVGQSFVMGTPFEGFLVKNGVDSLLVEGASELPYAIADFRCDLHMTQVGVPAMPWRSVGHTHTGYAVECFVDELLEAAGLDPVEGRLAMMIDAPRAAGVLRAVAELAQWSGPAAGNGRARGVAVVESFGSFVAQIAEVSAGDGDGPRVHKVWCAVDCGTAVNPDVIRAQMQGGIGYGLGHVLFGEVVLDGGRPVQRNFDTYRSLRINEMPQVEVAIVKSSEPPTGVGEPGVPPIGPAVANAMARLGIMRPSRLPIERGIA